MTAEKVLYWGNLVKTWQQPSWNCCEISGFHHTALKILDFLVVTLCNSLQEQSSRTLKLLHLGGGLLFCMYCCKCTCVLMTKKFSMGHVKYVVRYRQSFTKLRNKNWCTFSQNHTPLPFAGSHAVIRGSDVWVPHNKPLQYNEKWRPTQNIKSLGIKSHAARRCTRLYTLPICTAQDSFHIFWAAKATTSKRQL
jgi:hypothetical protein